MLRPSTTIKQSQEQKLSPQQIQFMKLLQVPVGQLEQRIKEEVEKNPLLEEGPAENTDQDDLSVAGPETEQQEDPTFDPDNDYLNDYIQDDPTTYKEQTRRSRSADEDISMPIEAGDSFIDYLLQQRRMLELNKEEELIADQIIGSIDPDGYLRRDNSAICYDLLTRHNIDVTEAEVEKVLDMVQQFDPPGIAARDPRECLLIQLDKKMEQADGENGHLVELATRLVRDHFEAYSRKKFKKLQDQLQISEDELRQVDELIRHLNPKPTSGLSLADGMSNTAIIPDFFVSARDGELQLRMNARDVPSLHVSDHYRDMLKKIKKSRESGKKLSSQDKDTFVYLKENLDSANWFIDAIRQRQNTLERTMTAIMEYQRDYFLTGDERKIQPMILKNIADITDLDISTVSRVVNSKYVQTQFGTKLLKELFSESLQTDQGEEVSTLQVKHILADIIEKEDKQDPYSDKVLTEMLKEQGYKIARRTVAKYREQLGLPVARLRKEL